MCARAKGGGCLVKRGNVYHARWVVDGQVFTRSTKCTIKKDALKKLDEFVHPYQVESDIETLQNLQSKINVLEGEANKTPKAKAIQLKFILDVYEKDINQSHISEATDRDYTSKFNKLIKFLKGKEYAYQVTEKDVDEFMMTIKLKDSVKTYNTYIKVMKRVFKIAMLHDTNIRKNPFDHLRFLKEPADVGRTDLSVEQLDKLVECAYQIGEEEGLFFKVGRFTGMRRGDVMSLKQSEINFEDMMIRKLPAKTHYTGIMYRIPIVPELYEDLKKVPKHEDGYVFGKIHDYSHWKISELVRKVFDLAEIPISQIGKDGKRHFVSGYHVFRHSIASILHKSRTPINQIKAILAHTKIDMSLHYAHVHDEDLVMPDLSNKFKTIKVSKDVYVKVMSYANHEDTFDEAIQKMIKKLNEQRTSSIDELRSAEEERKLREEQEIEMWFDELFDENGNLKDTVDDSAKKKLKDRGIIEPVAKEGAKGTWVDIKTEE